MFEWVKELYFNIEQQKITDLFFFAANGHCRIAALSLEFARDRGLGAGHRWGGGSKNSFPERCLERERET